MTFNFPKIIKSAETKLWRDMNPGYSLIDDFFKHYARGFPTIDISAKDSEYLLDVDLPGIDQKNIEIKLNDNVLTIQGKKEEIKDHKERNYYTHERFVGAFQRSIALPHDIKDSNIDASFKDGVLHIKIPKNNSKEKAKRIEIKA